MLVLILLLAQLVSGNEEFKITFGTLEQCSGLPDLATKIHQADFNYAGNNRYYISYNVTLDEDLDRPLDMLFDVQKCANEFAPCENYINYTVSDVCSELLVEGSIPNSMFEVAKVDPECPIKKGVRILEKEDVRIHPDLLQLGTYGNYWRFKVYLIKNETIPVLCLSVGAKVTKTTTSRKRKGQRLGV